MQHVSACLAFGSLLSTCDASLKPDRVFNDVDVGQCMAMHCQTTIKIGLDQAAQHVSDCLACGSFLLTCHVSKEPDNEVKTLDVKLQGAYSLLHTASCMIKYISVAAGTAKGAMFSSSDTQNRGVPEQHGRLP